MGLFKKLKKLVGKSPGMKLLKKDPIARKVMKHDPAAKLMAKTDPVLKGVRNEVVGRKARPMSKPPSSAVTGGTGQVRTKPKLPTGGTSPTKRRPAGSLNRKGIKSFYER